MGDIDNESLLKNFTLEIRNAKSVFKTYPHRVALETAGYKEGEQIESFLAINF